MITAPATFVAAKAGSFRVLALAGIACAVAGVASTRQ